MSAWRLGAPALPLVFCGSVAPAHRPIVTPRLVVRGARPDDAAELAATIDAEVRDRNGWTPGTELALLRSVEAGFGTDLGRLVVCDRDGGVVGEAQAWRRPDSDRWELGWWIGPAHRNQGFATEAVGAVLARCHDLEIRSVTFGCRADNLAVLAIAARVGAVVESSGPHQLPDGSTPDAVWFVHERTPVPAG
jgi:RimJ/RimL family protein N-acetyltransferase